MISSLDVASSRLSMACSLASRGSTVEADLLDAPPSLCPPDVGKDSVTSPEEDGHIEDLLVLSLYCFRKWDKKLEASLFSFVSLHAPLPRIELQAIQPSLLARLSKTDSSNSLHLPGPGLI